MLGFVAVENFYEVWLCLFRIWKYATNNPDGVIYNQTEIFMSVSRRLWMQRYRWSLIYSPLTTGHTVIKRLRFYDRDTSTNPRAETPTLNHPPRQYRDRISAWLSRRCKSRIPNSSYGFIFCTVLGWHNDEQTQQFDRSTVWRSDSFGYGFIHSFIHSFIPYRVLQQVHSLFQTEFTTQCNRVRPLSIFSFAFKLIQYLHTSSSHLPFTSIAPSTFLSVSAQGVPILLFTLCRIFLFSLTLCNTFSFLIQSVQLIFSILLQHHISNLSRYLWSTFQSAQVSAVFWM